ncbi:MAG: hypothetical protein GWN41_12300 [Phycisphaerae bacterium]|nr:hypothetical protein [Phycisphaerae bacterium]
MDWICDVADLIRVQQNLDWQGVIWLARELHIERTLYIGLTGLETMLPDSVLKAAKSDAVPCRWRLTYESNCFVNATTQTEHRIQFPSL